MKLPVGFRAEPYDSRHGPELVRMWRASFEKALDLVDPHSIEQQLGYLEEKVRVNHEITVVLDAASGAIAAFLAANTSEVDLLYVHVDYHGRGLGRALLDHAKELSHGQLRLFTFEKNLAARRFYEHAGFRPLHHGFEPYWQLADMRYHWTIADRLAALERALTTFNARRSFSPVETDLERHDLGGTTVFRSRPRADRHYNRAVGWSVEDVEHLDEIRAMHHEFGHASNVSLPSILCTPSALSALGARGYRLADTTSIFAGSIRRLDPTSSSILIRRGTPDDLPVIAELWAGDGEPFPAETIKKRAAEQFVDEFPIYLAEIQGIVVAMGTIFVSDEIAFLGNAHTANAYRRQDCQQALIDHRLGEARRLGCTHVASDAAYAGASHRNLVRAGLELLYTDLTYQSSM